MSAPSSLTIGSTLEIARKTRGHRDTGTRGEGDRERYGDPRNSGTMERPGRKAQRPHILPCSGFPYPFRGKPSGRRSRRLSLCVSRSASHASRVPPRPSVSPSQLLTPCGGKPLNPRALLCYCREQQGIVSGYRPITSDKDTEKGMKQVILGTAGHIDHGKTSLIKALTGIDTDRLKEEKLRGITIELGFAHLHLPSGDSSGDRRCSRPRTLCQAHGRGGHRD